MRPGFCALRQLRSAPLLDQSEDSRLDLLQRPSREGANYPRIPCLPIQAFQLITQDHPFDLHAGRQLDLKRVPLCLARDWAAQAEPYFLVVFPR